MILSHAADRPLAYEQAAAFARQRGHVFMMRWPSGHWTVETRRSAYASLIVRVSEAGAQRPERSPS